MPALRSLSPWWFGVGTASRLVLVRLGFGTVGTMDSFLSAALENQLLTVLALLSMILLVIVTGGVVYLTAIEWRDKRRRGDESRAMPARGAGMGKRQK